MIATLNMDLKSAERRFGFPKVFFAMVRLLATVVQHGIVSLQCPQWECTRRLFNNGSLGQDLDKAVRKIELRLFAFIPQQPGFPMAGICARTGTGKLLAKR